MTETADDIVPSYSGHEDSELCAVYQHTNIKGVAVNVFVFRKAGSDVEQGRTA